MPSKHQACTACGYPRKFLGMAEKVGKDGRTARWPEYEICPRKNDPKFHPAKARKDEAMFGWMTDESIKAEVKEAIRKLELPNGTLYQVEDIDDPLAEAGPCLEHFVEKFGRIPEAIGMNPEEAGDTTEIEWGNTKGQTIEIPIWHLKNISSRYGYLYLILEGQSRVN